jgi:hypothetical protein
MTKRSCVAEYKSPTPRLSTACLAAMCGASLLLGGQAMAAESGFSVYGLGGSSFNAGITPPAGTYVTGLGAYYTGTQSATGTIGGVTIDAGADVGFFQAGVNILHVPKLEVLGGKLGFSLTVPAGFVDLNADLTIGGTTLNRGVQGPGFGDVTPKVQLGWEQGTFFNTVYAQATLPTGKYDPGFNANIGLNRPAFDFGWAFTWIHPDSKIQLNATAGVTFNFENTATQYQSGNEFHLDWAVGKDFGNGLILGVVGYNYRQFTDDTGPGATLGAHRGSVDAVGLGLNYSTLLDKTPLSVSLRHYREFNVVNRWEGSTTLATATFAF